MKALLKTGILSYLLILSPACALTRCSAGSINAVAVDDPTNVYAGHGDPQQLLPALPPVNTHFAYTDIAQGQIGDCGLMSALAALAAYDPNALIDHLYVSADGRTMSFDKYAVSLRDVDYRFFQITDPNPFIQMWGFLAQAAFMKKNDAEHVYSLKSGAEGLVGFNTAHVFAAMTNGVIYQQNVDDPNAVWDTLTLLNTPMIAGTNFKTAFMVPLHDYTVMGAGLNANGDRVVRVRNPWGSTGPAEDGIEVMTFSRFMADVGILTFVR